MEKYNHKKIEKKWADNWRKSDIYKVEEDKSNPKKFYILDMFPYPSGSGLHVGHPKGYIATDIFARMKMLQEFNVLHPMGWDAFGLPAENFALKNKVHPREMNEKNIATFKAQLGKLGLTYDWSREIDTTDSEFYKWTQWIFLQMFKRGLAYESNEPINWCPSCKTGLANEDLEGGKCERCGSEIERKPMRQWVLRITDYADRLLKDLEKLPKWEEAIKEMQKNWIGRSEGAKVNFKLSINNFQFSKIYFATGNKSKIERLKKVFSKVNPEIEIEAVPELIEVEEKGKNGAEIARKKAEVYKEKYEYPVMSLDTSFHLANQDFDPTQVKRMALDGRDEKEFSQEEIAQKMVDFYMDIAREAGGEKDFYFKDSWAMLMPDGEIKQAKYNRDYILTDKMQTYLDVFMPIRSLYIVKATGKNSQNQSEEEFFQEFSGQVKAMRELTQASIEVFTTRPDTLFGATYMVVAPEHELITNYEGQIANLDEVKEYVKKAQNKSDLERTDLNKDKTGVEIKGIKAINPVNGEELPIFVADYVLAGYGTGAIMAVPAHDERDRDFAVKYFLPIKYVVEPQSFKNLKNNHFPWYIPGIGKEDEYLKEVFEDLKIRIKEEEKNSTAYAYTGEGIAVNSDFLNGLKTHEAKEKMIEWLEEKGVGERAVNYKLKDWVFSRQRYWGEPIPIVHCEKCGIVGVPEEDLPVKLPDVEHYEPTGTGESPLANIDEWVNVKCPKCGGAGKRETNTMPQWAGSSWYYLRYIDPHNDEALVDKGKEKYWSPVDFYVGGAEHATRHLIYARFWHKFLYDIGAVAYDEPFSRFQYVGLILAEDGRKMSKRWGNVINPDNVVESYGADAMRVYEMFMGPFSQACAWSTNGLKGARGFLDDVWNYLFDSILGSFPDEKGFKQWIKGEFKPETSQNIKIELNKTIKKVEEDIENFKFNTAISQLMIFKNCLYKIEKEQKILSSSVIQEISGRIIAKEDFEKFLIILSPFAPHLAEEIWEKLGNKESIFKQKWPKYDKNLIKEDKITLAIQINGKVRGEMEVSADIGEEEAKQKALETDIAKKWIADKEVKKVIYVKDKLVNIVVI